MIGTLITSQTRTKLIRKFFLNSSNRAHLRGLVSEFGESSNSIRIELNRFEKAGLLTSFRVGNKKVFQANSKHPLFNDIQSIILKETGIDRLIEKVMHRVGNLKCVYLTGDFAKGKDSAIIDLIIIGDDIDREYLARKVVQAEEIVGRKVSYVVFNQKEAENSLMELSPSNLLTLWNLDENNLEHNIFDAKT